MIDDQGITHHGLVRTRRFPWARVTELLVKDDGVGRARVEVVSDSGEHTAVWSGSVDDPVLVQITAYGHDFAAGAEGSRRRGVGCLIAFLVCLSLFSAFSALIALTVHYDANVDPAEVPAGIDIWTGSAPAEGAPRRTWVVCAAPLDPRPAWEPASCTGSRRAQLWWTVGLAATAAASAAVSVAAIRAARRASALPDVGPIVGGARP